MRRVRLFGIPVARHLHFIGAGLSDYLSPIIRAGHERPVLEAFAGYLADTTREWDVFDLTDVNESMACARILPSVFGEKHLPVYRYQGTVCPGILLTSSFENLVQLPGLSKNYNLKRKFRKLRLHFQSEINLVRSETDDIDRAVEDFALIHGGRWKSQGYPSAFDDPHNKAFHVEVCRKFAARDWLRMYFLKVDGRRIASCFNFNYRKKIYMYQSNAHGPDNVMKCSPGFLIRSVAIDEGIREGMRVFDFLRGNETYKYSEWNATDSKNWLIRTSSTSGCGKISFFLFLISEFITKAGDRLFREYREYRRFRISGKGRFNSIRYLWRRCSYLAGTVIHFFSRHTHLSGKESGRGESGDF